MEEDHLALDPEVMMNGSVFAVGAFPSDVDKGLALVEIEVHALPPYHEVLVHAFEEAWDHFDWDDENLVGDRDDFVDVVMGAFVMVGHHDHFVDPSNDY